MYSPEDTICGFVAGISGRPIVDVQPGHTLLHDLGLKPHDIDLLARLIENEYGVKPSADEILGWKRMQDVTTFIRLNVQPTSCANGASNSVVSADEPLVRVNACRGGTGGRR